MMVGGRRVEKLRGDGDAIKTAARKSSADQSTAG